MKRILTTVVAVMALVTAGLGGAAFHTSAAHADDAANIVGVWEVTAQAPYPPHLATFHRDGTMVIANPTNVQENPSAPHGGTNDSLGQGVWKVVVADNGTKYIEGTFEELNAFADNHQPTDTLSVSFKLQLGNNDSSFDGPASASIAGQTFPSHLTGTRVTIDQAAIDAL
ncbi:MAG TPA: hypothetical protein VLE99_02910 [Candidatus Saccharimonadales bacterium]|nr:hypothetical protein [Candidatus Saccharimonadales bacterium]